MTEQNKMSETKSGEWKYGLFSCFEDMKACCYVCCCPTCAMGTTYKNMGFGSFFSGCCIAGSPWAPHHKHFTKPIREEKGIEGNCCTDACTFLWCGPCMMCREYREAHDHAAAQ